MTGDKILVLGVSGMLGHKLFGFLAADDRFQVSGSARTPAGWLKHFPFHIQQKIHFNIEIEDVSSITGLIERFRPDWVINCIGIVKPDTINEGQLASIYGNAWFPHKLAQICAKYGARLLHISTDCVFSGLTGSYVETDTPDAADLYGRCKLLGEVDYPHCLTIRTSIIGHELVSKRGLVEWFLAQSGPVLGYTHHIFTGFPTVELARIIADYILIHPELEGIYHLSSHSITKYELLKLVAVKYGKSIAIEPYDKTFCDRSLDSSRLRSLIHYDPPSWPELMEAMHRDYITYPYGNRLEELSD
jgi:dTDP-4-dehydrorhamnose reductase